ncbi:MAG TPA: glutathione S-transferase family protein [Polyangiaceae bacterium]|nr:glutathione S-transferase family protein [Polyangiaceae bacterium]
MTITLYHHPFSRAANVIWMLEEAEVDYDLRFVDIMKGAHKEPDIVALNPMGKLPIVTDGELVVTESAAIALYLADRYAAGRLAPPLDDPKRGRYLRWAFFAPSVIEPGLMAKASGWAFKEGSAGWGNHAAMLDAMESALANGPYVLGDTFSMADVVFGGTIGFMLGFDMLEKRSSFVAYAERLGEREAKKRADEKNAAIRKEHGIEPG